VTRERYGYTDQWAKQEAAMTAQGGVIPHIELDINVPVPAPWHFGPPKRGWGRSLSGLGDARADAERLFDQGVALFRAANYSEAADKFGQANELMPHATTMIWVAQSGARLGSLMLQRGMRAEAAVVLTGALDYLARARAHTTWSTVPPADRARLEEARGIIESNARQAAGVVSGGTGAALPLLALVVGLGWLYTRR
jgi:hypothetical protein